MLRLSLLLHTMRRQIDAHVTLMRAMTRLAGGKLARSQIQHLIPVELIRRCAESARLLDRCTAGARADSEVHGEIRPPRCGSGRNAHSTRSLTRWWRWTSRGPALQHRPVRSFVGEGFPRYGYAF
jgi:hypothetical protein